MMRLIEDEQIRLYAASVYVNKQARVCYHRVKVESTFGQWKRLFRRTVGVIVMRLSAAIDYKIAHLQNSLSNSITDRKMEKCSKLIAVYMQKLNLSTGRKREKY